MARADATPPRTDGPAGAVAATGCVLTWWWFLAALLLLLLAWWAVVPWWRARSTPVRSVEPVPPAQQPLSE